MEASSHPVTRADLEEFTALLRADIERSAQTLRSEIEQSAQTLRSEIEQSAQALRKDISHVDKSVAGIAGELRVFKWAVSLALAAIVGGLGMLYQGVTDLRTEMYSGDNALREEIADLGERTARLGEGQRQIQERLTDLDERTFRLDERTVRLEEGQRHIQQRLTELIDLANARASAPAADGASSSPS